MIAQYFLYFIIYSFIGWFWEVLVSLVKRRKLVNRGFLNGPYCPIYGVGAIIFILINPYVNNPVLLFFIGGLIACIVEYITSVIMEKLFGARWWDYSDKPLNINGRVCLYGYIAFGIGAIIVSLVQPHIQLFINNLPNRDTIAIITASIFVLDIISTNHSIAKFSRIMREYQKIIKNGRVVQFFEAKSKKLFAKLPKRTLRIFTFQQRRIINAFPHLKTGYDKAITELQALYQKTKFKPEESANARQKSKKILK